MPIEEYRNLYIGRTPNFVNLYLGSASAQHAKFLYDKAGIEFELKKTELLLSVDDFAFLRDINALSFKNDGDQHVVSDVRAILEAHDIMRRRSIMKAASSMYGFGYPYVCKDCILHNKNEEITIILSAEDIPTTFSDAIFTCMDWSIIEEYSKAQMDHVTFTSIPVRDLVYGTFHMTKLSKNDAVRKVMLFKQLYLDI